MPSLAKGFCQSSSTKHMSSLIGGPSSGKNMAHWRRFVRISLVALSATLPSRIRTDVFSKLRFGNEYDSFDVGNDRNNVSIVVRSIQHPMKTYADLDFIISNHGSRRHSKNLCICRQHCNWGWRLLTISRHCFHLTYTNLELFDPITLSSRRPTGKRQCVSSKRDTCEY